MTNKKSGNGIENAGYAVFGNRCGEVEVCEDDI